MSPYNLPSITRSLFRDHLSLFFALLWNIPCRFSITIVLYIISSLHIVLILCARVGWCDIGSDFTNLIKVDPRNNWQLCTCSARFITLTDMCSFCWQKCGLGPKLFLRLDIFSKFRGTHTDFSIRALCCYWLSTWGTTKLINRPGMKYYLVINYTLPSTWLKSTQAEIQNDGGSLGLVISLKTRSRLSHLIKRESLMFSLRQYCLDFPIFTMIDSKFHFSPTFTSNLFFWTRNKNDRRLKHMTSSTLSNVIAWSFQL